MKHIALFLVLGFLSSELVFSQKSFIEKSGDLIQIGIPAIAFGSTLFLKSTDKPHWQFVKSLGTSLIITHSLKRIINKKRPDGGAYSFPSGHTSAAFTGAAFIQKRYGWKYGIPSYILASYVGYSRVHANRHDYYDVLAGAGIGIISSFFFTKPYEEKNIQLSFKKNNDNDLLISFNYTF